MTVLRFDVAGHGARAVRVRRVLNAGFAGVDQEKVAAHIEELVELGVPRPASTPTLYPLAPDTVTQDEIVWVHGERTSGEAEWVLVIDDDGEALITVGSDHTDRELEAYRIEWGKQIAPNVLAGSAWLLSDVVDASLRIRSWTGDRDHRELLQDGTAADLLPVSYWLDVLRTAGLLEPGTVLFGGTFPMLDAQAQFAPSWTVRLDDERHGTSIEFGYRVRRHPQLYPADITSA